MKVENNVHNIEEINWKYLPNIYQLSQYLPQPDLIQLSLTCSQLRNKLSSVIFRKLELIKGGEIFPGRPNIPSRRTFFYFLIHILENRYSDKYCYVKHCILWEPCNNYFITKLFSTFTFITKLELYLTGTNINSYASNPDSSSYLTCVLKPLKKLEVLIIDYKLIISPKAGIVSNFELPKCLKVFDVVGCFYGGFSFGPIDNINGDYTKLRKITIINDKMLIKLSEPIKSLAEITIINKPCYIPKLYIQFFSFNPQLKKISITIKFIESNVINSILQLKKLDSLKITQFWKENTKELNGLTINTSIKHLVINCNITQSILLPILSSTKSLHILEFSNCNFQIFNTINWSLYAGKIPLLHLNSVRDINFDLKKLLNSTIFDKIRLTNIYALEYCTKFYEFDELKNWNIIQDDPSNIWEFCLARKLEEEVNK